MRIRVLLADDHQMLRDGLKALLSANEDIEVVAEVSDGREAVRIAQELNPDVVMMDVSMAELNGIEATRQLRDRRPKIRVVILSMHSSSEHVFRALEAGATGYLLKDSAGREAAEAVRAAHAGKRYLSPALGPMMMEGRSATARKSPLERLTARERQVLQLVVEGHSSARIAELVHLSPKSIGTYRSRLMKKLGVHDVAALVKFAVQHGITPSG